MEAVAAAGIRVICYNFMPVIDWTRTDLAWELPERRQGAAVRRRRLRRIRSLHPERPGAERRLLLRTRSNSPNTPIAASLRRNATRSCGNIIAGLPGGMSGSYDPRRFRAALARYQGMSGQTLPQEPHRLPGRRPSRRGAPRREACDPSRRPALPAPRIARGSSRPKAMRRSFLRLLPSESNGLTLCTGSFGVRADNDLPAMARRFAARIHFAHLRTTTRETAEASTRRSISRVMSTSCQ